MVCLQHKDSQLSGGKLDIAMSQSQVISTCYVTGHARDATIHVHNAMRCHCHDLIVIAMNVSWVRCGL